MKLNAKLVIFFIKSSKGIAALSKKTHLGLSLSITILLNKIIT
jgi:hypothetical protein